ncbi:MAG TPA: hypothetical protein DCS07_14195 [Bdellovibrionales bacterium]|nr:MAG: hypothetical protein A2Z97_01155 [Bdellovibrionales bacterium GWB1_52_6]OFZ05430.1 MAG: hypothetical protein A2X97_11155 [Bdellovibrionales bacterium GWA1_52_35]OFZ41451.1 MAG: hypothetical protein A2070_01565 [Bdellovibrionales bacterium GWC1_52_8]HAR43762.1 hypothetical protein [Bdellovibrionales bacterium]HCM39208.1 hypothetical protein [Bdellovibrionales bacterium]
MRNFAKNPRGFSITAMTMASGALGVLMLVVLTLFTLQSKSIVGLRVVNSRDSVKAMLARYAEDAQALNNSAENAANKTSAFGWCVQGTSTCNEANCCKAGISFPFTLLDPSVSPQVVAGPTGGTPAYYALDGTKCEASLDDRCPIQAHTSFVADCGTGITECVTPKQITVSYTIEQVLGRKLPLGALKQFTGTAVSTFPLGEVIVNRLAKFNSDGAVRSSSMYEDAAGNLGIGTSNPFKNITILDEQAFISYGFGPGGYSAGLTVLTKWDGADIHTTENRGWNFATHIYNPTDDGATGNLTLNRWNRTVNIPLLIETGTGHVGIGDTIHPEYPLDVEKDIRVSECVYANAVAPVPLGTCPSDARLKSGIHRFRLGLDVLQGVLPKYFKYNGLGGQPESKVEQLGVVAQELEKVAPELVGTLKSTEFKTVHYGGLLYVLINSVKELYLRWTESEIQLQARLREERQRNTDLRMQLEALERRNEAIKSRLVLIEEALQIKGAGK